MRSRLNGYAKVWGKLKEVLNLEKSFGNVGKPKEVYANNFVTHCIFALATIFFEEIHTKVLHVDCSKINYY